MFFGTLVKNCFSVQYHPLTIYASPKLACWEITLSSPFLCKTSRHLSCDQNAIVQVIGNFLGNAI